MAYDSAVDKPILYRCPLSVGDDVGVVFFGTDTVYRAIDAAHQNQVSTLVSSGLLDELTHNGLFPKTTISRVPITGYPLVLAHEKIGRTIYPCEWSPEMLRSAARCVLEVNAIAGRYGYQLKDAHPYNVMFRYNSAMYVDLGSFIRLDAGAHWSAYDEFVNCYVRTMMLVQKGLVSVYKHAFLLNGRGYDRTDLFAMTSMLPKLIGLHRAMTVQRLLSIYHRGPSVGPEIINRRFKNRYLRSLATFVLHSRLLPRRDQSVAALLESVNRIDLSGSSQWGNYYNPSNVIGKSGKFHMTKRFDWVLGKVNDLGATSVTDIASNRGLLSRELLRLPNVREVICIDYDEKAIDALHREAKTQHIYPACFDFMRNIAKDNSNSDSHRFRSDMVLALALTHHLVLTQGFRLDSVFRALATYTTHFLMVEFMPLGLWDGRRAPPLPNWYTEDWFAGELGKRFRILDRESLEPNRICFVGELKQAGPGAPTSRVAHS